MNCPPTVILESLDRNRDSASYAFSGLTEIVTARSRDEVIPALRRIEDAAARGRHAAGFISYEAAPGLNDVLPTLPSGPLPLLWFGLFDRRRTVPPGEVRRHSATSPAQEWRTSLDKGEYGAAVGRIRDYIAAGDAYQVNFTLRRRFHCAGDATALHRNLCDSQPASFCAFIDTGRFQLLSASPELFFRLRDGVMTVRPMKGTAPRGRWWEEDEEAKKRLREDPKERAENLMIVDLMRNDLGMIAETGTVNVASLFDIETLPSLHQMTSTITAELKENIGLVEIFRAIFPCGSVTGAPKKRAMEIIAELEDAPRGVYTGCIGYISPGKTLMDSYSGVCQGGEEEATEALTRPSAPLSQGERDRERGIRRGTDDEANTGRRSKSNPIEAVFSVAIRTVVIDSESGEGEMGVGSGITWDSKPEAEYRESLAKGDFALTSLPGFRLVETLRFEMNDGYYLLDRHQERLRRSASYFGFTFRASPLRSALLLRAAQLDGDHKVRLQLDRKGTFTITTGPLPPAGAGESFPVAFAEGRTDSRDPFLYHKTDNRALYRDEPTHRPDCTDVIFLNERGEVTEGANHNIVARIGGDLVTPPLSCGLLPGVFREELLARGEIVERIISPDELAGAEEVWLINSVRKWRRARLV